MKKTNVYYRKVHQRPRLFTGALLGFFLIIGSLPSLFIEVFIRRNMGERAISRSCIFLVALINALLPYIAINFRAFMNPYGNGSASMWEIIMTYPSWYLVLAAFVYMAYKRYQETKSEPGVFDFARFSLSTGDIDARFYNVKLFGKRPTPRQVSTILEPALFLAIGLLFALLQQAVGYNIMVCAIIYAGRNFAAYGIGDDCIMNHIDNIICGEELLKIVSDEDNADNRGFTAYGNFPKNPTFRRKVVESMLDDEETADVF